MTGLQELRDKMDSGVQCFGPSITLKDPVIAEALGLSVRFPSAPPTLNKTHRFQQY
ncbi:MAG: hypothetical protein CFH37_00722 [Alphaproteobacteria bacterium MarineAlpha9_Bin7]|nr:MAG: hypothetical protein CFH37_00722 [Alphaproteobacteria bacterium MarineAlpha9_Bin7]